MYVMHSEARRGECPRPSASGGTTLLRAILLTVSVRVFAAVIFLVAGGQIGFRPPDSHLYRELAEGLLHGSFYTFGVAQVYRTPGYPLLLAPAVASGHVLLTGIALNYILAAFSTALVWKIAVDVSGSERAAFWAAALYAVEPVGLLASEQLLSETLFTAAFLLAVLLLLSLLRTGKRGRLVAAAIAFGACCYIKPIGEVVGIAVASLLLFLPRSARFGGRAARSLIFLGAFVATLVPWILRNHFVTGFNGFSSSGGYELYYVSGAAAKAHAQHVPFAELAPGTGAKVAQVAPRGEPWKTIRAYPLAFAYVQARGSVVAMLDPCSTELLKRLGAYPREGGMLAQLQDHGVIAVVRAALQRWPMLLSLLALGLIALAYYLAAIYGLLRVPRDAAITLAFLIIVFALFSASAGSTGRLRAPIMPLVCIAASIAIAWWREKDAYRFGKIRGRQERRWTV